MKITDEQQKVLDSFICERFSANDNNTDLIDTFTSKKGSSLVDYFREYGLLEDASGETAYYIIKTQHNEILMFFSIKCGSLFNPLADEDEVIQDFQRLVILLQAMENVNIGKNNQIDKKDIEEAKAILLKYQVGDRISFEDFNKIVKGKAKSKKQFLKHLFDDKRKEDNGNILRVQKTHPAIELVHFCVNDNMKKKWKKYKLGHTMGETLFWKFIVPKFFDIQSIAGCEYVFLFAADLSEDGSLVNYYDVSLKFQKQLDVGTNKPFYDFCCVFMCQKVNDMKKYRKEFFLNFNIDEDDIIA